MKATFIFAILMLFNLSMTLFLPPGSPHSAVMLNSSTPARPLVGSYHLRNNGWPEEGERLQVPKTDLYWRAHLYGRSVPLRWDFNVAEAIHEIEEQLRTQPLHELVHDMVENGQILVWFERIDAQSSITTREAAELLGSIWALTVAFGPREIRPGLVGTANREKKAVFELEFPGIP